MTDLAGLWAQADRLCEDPAMREAVWRHCRFLPPGVPMLDTISDRAALPPPGGPKSPTTTPKTPMTLRRLLSRRVGEGAGRPGLARCCFRVTVSTKQTCPA